MRTLILLLCSVQALFAATNWVAPTGVGDNGNPGTYASPWGTLAYGVANTANGDVLGLKNGYYTERLTIGHRNATVGSQFTVAAEDVFGVTISASGTPATVYIYDSQYVNLDGIVVTNNTTGSCVWFHGAEDCTFTRSGVSWPNNLANFSGVGFHGNWAAWSSSGDPCRRNLAEDIAVMGYHRHAFSFGGGAESNTVRRIYINDMGRVCDPSYYAADAFIKEGISQYGGSWNRMENVIIDHGYVGVGLSVIGNNEGGQGISWLGCVVRNWNRSASIMNSRTAGANYLTAAAMTNVAIIGSTQDGFTAWHGNPLTYVNCVSASNAVNGWKITQEDFFWALGGAAQKDALLQTNDHAAYLKNCISVRNQYPFYLGYETNQGGYQGTHTTTLVDCTGWGNTYGLFQDPDSHVVLNNSGYSTANPNYDVTKYGPGAYLLPPPGAPGRGATIIYQYQDGVLTTNALWPWPMESYISNRWGVSVTYEAYGGIWRTLDDVYGLPPTDPPVQVSVIAKESTAYESPLTPAQFQFDRNDTTAEIEVHFTISGSATSGVHYIGFSDTVTFGIGVATVYATVTPIDVSAIKTVIVTLDSDPLDPDTYTPTTSSATIYIVPEAVAGSGFRPPPGQRSVRTFP